MYLWVEYFILQWLMGSIEQIRSIFNLLGLVQSLSDVWSILLPRQPQIELNQDAMVSIVMMHVVVLRIMTFKYPYKQNNHRIWDRITKIAMYAQQNAHNFFALYFFASKHSKSYSSENFTSRKCIMVVNLRVLKISHFGSEMITLSWIVSYRIQKMKFPDISLTFS